MAYIEQKLIRPNGGEVWFSGDTSLIQWRSGIKNSNVKIEFSSDSGKNWGTIIENTPNDGLYEWRISVPISEKCLIRVTDTLASIIRSDTSDQVFRIADSVLIPSILKDPSDQTVFDGDIVTFDIAAVGKNILYQWKKDGIIIPDANSSSYTTMAVSTNDNGALYSCVISNNNGSVESKPAKLTVIRIPKHSITVNGLSDVDQVYLNASNGWYGSYSANGNYTFNNLQAGYYYLGFRSVGKRSEIRKVLLGSDSDTVITVTLKDAVEMAFSDTVSINQKNGVPMNLGTLASVILEDIDNDGDDDIIAGYPDNSADIFLYSTGEYKFENRLFFSHGVLRCIRSIDWDNDGKRDLIVGFDNGTIDLYVQQSNLNFRFTTTVMTGAGTITGFDICDFNFDGTIELLIGKADGSVYISQINDTETQNPVLLEDGSSLDIGEPVSICVLDISGDGNEDILAATHSGLFIWYKNDKTGKFTPMGDVNINGKSSPYGSSITISSVKAENGLFPSLIITTGHGVVCQVDGVLEGDFNNDGVVNLIDFGLFVDSWRTKEGESGWNPKVNMDLNKDPASGLQIINLSDFGKFVDVWRNER